MDRRQFLTRSGSATVFSASPLLDWFDDSEREQTIERVEEALDDIFEPFRGDDVVADAGRTAATALCDIQPEDSLSDGDVESTRHANSPQQLPIAVRHHIRRFAGIVEIFTNRFDVELDLQWVQHVDAIMARAENVVPLVYASDQVFSSACDVHDASDDSLEEEQAFQQFLTDSAMFVAELLMIKFSAGYRFAFNGTRLIANRLLVHVRGLVGLEVYALLLREVHWALRGSLVAAANEIVDAIVSLTQSLQDEFPTIYEEAFNDGDIEALKALKEDIEYLHQLSDIDLSAELKLWGREDEDLVDWALDLPSEIAPTVERLLS